MTREHKQDSKGVQWLVRGNHYTGAAAICERDKTNSGIKKKELAKDKTKKCKELHEAFLRVISEALLNVLVNEEARMTLDAELQEEVQNKYEAYRRNPEDEQLLRALAELGKKIEDEQSHKTADGDTKNQGQHRQ